MNVFLEIRHADGRLERRALEGAQITLGSGTVAGIVLDDPQLEPEHVLFAPNDLGCWVAVARGARLPVLVAGQAFSEGALPWGTELLVGDLSIRLQRDVATKAASNKPSPVILAALIVGVPAAIWLCFGAESSVSSAAGTVLVDPPPLFEETTDCDVDAARAQLRGDETFRAALAKEERYPFDARDGVRAVNLFRRARQCYEVVGDDERARTVAASLARLEKRLEEDYVTYRLRLSRALENRRPEDALVSVRALLSLLEHESGYRTKLEQVERSLLLAMDRAVKKKGARK